VVSSLTAVVVMVVTATAGYFTQRAIRQQEFVLAQTDAHLKQTRETITSIYELLATIIAATTERRKVAGGVYDELAPEQLRALMDNVNRDDARWPREREISEMLIYLYFEPGATVQQEWPRLKTRVQAYVDCVELVYLKYQEDSAPADSCEAERKAAEAQLEALRTALVMEYGEARVRVR
jgi:hypothetical protein